MAELKHRKQRVTPKQAATWLATNKDNRNLSDDWVTKIARDMAAGEFPNIGETIKFDEEGRLIDGQHRLKAVVESGVPIEFLIVEGIAREHRYKMDRNRKRKAADELHMKYKIPSATMAAAVARLVLQWQVGEIKSEGLKPTDTEVVEFVAANRDAVADAVRYGMSLRNDIGASPSATGALYFLTFEIDAADAMDFWEAVRTGTGLHEGDPELTLRNAIIKMNQVGHGAKLVKPFLAMLTQAWNTKRGGRKIRRLAPKPLTELTDEHFLLV